MNDKAEDLVYGRWPDILQARGLDASYFSGRAGPCPLCNEGKDRFVWKKNVFGGAGGYFCRQCGTGSYQTGFELLMRHMGYKTFKEAADDVREFFAGGPGTKPAIHRAPVVPSRVDPWNPEVVERNRARMIRLWEQAVPITAGDPVHRYMQHRSPGLDLELDGLRFHPELEYWAPPVSEGGRPVLLGKFPAMLAMAIDPLGDFVQLHKTYLTHDGYKADVPLVKKTELGVGVNSFAVRMMEPLGDVLGICEGIETGWGAARLQGIPVWPCLNGPALAKFVLPEYLLGQVRKLVIFADSDELKVAGKRQDGALRMRRAGSSYAEEAAIKARAMRLRVLVIRPAKTGYDFEDHFNDVGVTEAMEAN